MMPKVIECGSCGKRFKDILKFTKHVKKAHPKGNVTSKVVDK